MYNFIFFLHSNFLRSGHENLYSGRSFDSDWKSDCSLDYHTGGRLLIVVDESVRVVEPVDTAEFDQPGAVVGILVAHTGLIDFGEYAEFGGFVPQLCFADFVCWFVFHSYFVL